MTAQDVDSLLDFNVI